ncbi:MAG: hypothetical protein IBX48_10000, partial [Thiomicrospira sp.]|uniref:hypothetical protein n=1 Tax=Thiomicrospira sp. TaxID=935 RepID=UPI0019DFE16E
EQARNLSEDMAFFKTTGNVKGERQIQSLSGHHKPLSTGSNKVLQKPVTPQTKPSHKPAALPPAKAKPAQSEKNADEWSEF